MINNHVSIISPIPDDIFNNSLDEALIIDWEFYNKFDPRSKDSGGVYFSTSKTIHLRKHDVSAALEKPISIETFNNTVDCVDTAFRSNFLQIEKLIDYVYNFVNGKRVGRIMIINLLPGGEVLDHIDPGLYFQTYRRFHVPLKTNEGVLFKGKLGSDPIHMPVGYLCQLNNRNTHSVKNSSTEGRIHLLIDIETDDSRFSFGDDDSPSCQNFPPNPNNRLQLRPIYSTIKDFTPVNTLWPEEIKSRRFSGQYLIKYASIKNKDSAWVNSYFKNGTDLNINIRAVTMHKLKPFWDDYARYFQAAIKNNIMFTRMKFENYENDSIDYVSVWDAELVDEFDKSFKFIQPINANNLQEALEEFEFLFSGFKFFVNATDVLNFIKYCKTRVDNKDNARFETAPQVNFIKHLQTLSL